MSAEESRFKLPNNIERYLAILSKAYAREAERQLQEIIVNSQIRVHEAWSVDNWDGGTYGHALYLVLPEPLFALTLKQKDDYQKKIKEDLNNINNAHNEFIEEVFLEVDIGENADWRKESGLLLLASKSVAPDAAKRIWGENGEFRIFLSHKSEVKKEAAALGERLRSFGVSCFVAHVDIKPTKEWQDEIESALASMDGFVALLTDKFHESDWTDQEVGFAFARGVPIVAVRMGRDPYGFIGKFQGLASSWETCALELVKILIKHDRMFTAYLRALRECPIFNVGNMLAGVLPAIDYLNRTQIDEIVSAYNETTELRGCFAFNGKSPFHYGSGLVPHLNRLGASKFIFGADGLIEPLP